jgi:predicted TIM-barrel fold metal-dependent hydrolase
MEEVSNAISKFDNLRAFVNIHPEEIGALDKLEYAIKDLNYIGLKLHPRLQEFDLESKACSDLVKKAGELNVPVLICGFPDGTMIMRGFSPMVYANLAKECFNTHIIWAHMGGHYVLDFMMNRAKNFTNNAGINLNEVPITETDYIDNLENVHYLRGGVGIRQMPLRYIKIIFTTCLYHYICKYQKIDFKKLNKKVFYTKK